MKSASPLLGGERQAVRFQLKLPPLLYPDINRGDSPQWPPNRRQNHATPLLPQPGDPPLELQISQIQPPASSQQPPGPKPLKIDAQTSSKHQFKVHPGLQTPEKRLFS